MIDAKMHPLAENVDSCVGCAACAAACPLDAIEMKADAEGFAHPQIKLDQCQNCKLCRKICPVNQQNKAWEYGVGRINPPKVFAAWHLDETIRRASSSGGVFSALADYVLARDGVVAGAAFDGNLVVRHVLIEKKADLHRLRGSKYVQSDLSPDLYCQIEDLLQRDRYVLFSGTPCQVAGLRCFLRKHHDRLFCCDLICHGVPSPLLFARYLRFNREQKKEIVQICFRDKTAGWKNVRIRYW